MVVNLARFDLSPYRLAANCRPSHSLVSPFFDIQNSNLALYTSFHECGQGLLQTHKLPMLWICTVWQRTIQVYSVISSKRQYLQIVNIDLKTRWAYKPSWAPISYRSSDKWVRSSLITIEQPEPWSMDWRSGLAVYLEARSYRASLYENGNLWSSPACQLVICHTKKKSTTGILLSMVITDRAANSAITDTACQLLSVQHKVVMLARLTTPFLSWEGIGPREYSTPTTRQHNQYVCLVPFHACAVVQ